MADDKGDSPDTRASLYREICNAVRTLAVTVKNMDVSDELYLIAADYELLAQHVENFPQLPPPTGYWR
jgi:hypothetical protein